MSLLKDRSWSDVAAMVHCLPQIRLDHHDTEDPSESPFESLTSRRLNNIGGNIRTCGVVVVEVATATS